MRTRLIRPLLNHRGPRPRAGTRIAGLSYDGRFVGAHDRREILEALATLHPIWEERYAPHHPPPAGEQNRKLLRPIYWLGDWQFACLGYYRPPRATRDCAVRAEPFPPVLARLVSDIESRTRRLFAPRDIPRGWHLNTCLINYYGSRIENGKRIDVARVGEHKDFEPGPVASVSLGERALFQFIASRKKGERDRVVHEMWLDDGSLQIFGGPRWKSEFFHRVQRVDRRAGAHFDIAVDNFDVRRINFTFRFVPDADIVAFAKLDAAARDDVTRYVTQLAEHSAFWRAAAERR
ncbi:MAG: alpha-ketoglutarate-dependent dioxygenase AlkB [Deltaproteobacteria bacterium]|nr:alpha-ketoglutarate-dependent dioxygenase AlkB [Deltaproteobacteria bacterium]